MHASRLYKEQQSPYIVNAKPSVLASCLHPATSTGTTSFVATREVTRHPPALASLAAQHGYVCFQMFAKLAPGAIVTLLDTLTSAGSYHTQRPVPFAQQHYRQSCSSTTASAVQVNLAAALLPVQYIGCKSKVTR